MEPNPAAMLMNAAVPAFKCPTGTKMHILDLGTLQADESWSVNPDKNTQYQQLTPNRLLRGSNASTLTNKNPKNKRRDLILISALIEYPGVGLILFETGCAEDLDVVRPPSTEGRHR